MRIVCVVGLGLSLGATCAAHAERWTPVGPPGGSVRALAADPRDPRRLYLGTADGVLYRSGDAGSHWQRPAPGFPRRGMSLDAIAVGEGGALFVGFWEVNGTGGGVARSDDGGRTFKLLPGVDHESVRALAMAPSDPHVLAAGARNGVFLSRDGGRAWSRITPEGHPDLRNIESLAFDPGDARVLYAGTWHLAWKTVDAGQTWSPVHRGMIDDSDVMSLSVDSRDPQQLYATACTGIYRSTHGGAEWSKLRGIDYSSRRTRAFAVADDGQVLLAGTTEGLWASADSGATWRRSTAKDLVVNAVLVQPDGTILLGTEGAGVQRSMDRGQTWSASNDGFSERFISHVLFDPSGRRIVIVARGGARYDGVFTCTDLPGPWAHLDEGLESRHVLSMTIVDGTLYAGTDDGLFARGAGASSWTRVAACISGTDSHGAVKLLLGHTPGRLLAVTANGLIRSGDGGQSWSAARMGARQIMALAQSNRDDGTVLAAASGGVFRSTDGGASWNQISSGLRAVTTHALVFDPTNDRVLFATTSGGLFRSADQGASWTLVSGGLPRTDLSGIAMHPDGRTLYVSDFATGGIYRSADGGATWRRTPVDGLTSDHVWALAIHPESPDRLLASTSSGGLHVLVVTPQSAESESIRERANAGR